jgi:hypothetical protein
MRSLLTELENSLSQTEHIQPEPLRNLVLPETQPQQGTVESPYHSEEHLMGQKKKKPTIAEASTEQLAGLKAIDPELDLGEGCSVQALQDLINRLRDKVNAHKEALSTIDAIKLEIEALEEELKQLQQKVRLGVAFKFGKESREFRLVGGTSPTEAARKAVITRLKGKSGESSEEAK